MKTKKKFCWRCFRKRFVFCLAFGLGIGFLIDGFFAISLIDGLIVGWSIGMIIGLSGGLLDGFNCDNKKHKWGKK